MLALLISVFAALCSSFRTRAALQLEILALRHQINVLRRSQRGRVHLTSADRLFWTWLMYLWSGWRSALAIVKPETVIAWHRKAFRLCWTWKNRHGQAGRPALAKESRELIRKMSLANPLWGAPRIHGELLKLGIDGSLATVARCTQGGRRLRLGALSSTITSPSWFRQISSGWGR
jgi:putative transposase